MITVNDLISKLQEMVKVHPGNGMRGVYLMHVDGETCFEFGSGIAGDHVDGQHSLIFTPNQKGHVFKMMQTKVP